MAAPKGNCFNPNGRPKKEINWQVFEDLCSIQCTHEELESILRVDRCTLYDRAKEKYEEDDFSTIYKRFSSNGKSSLRRDQLKLAKKNAAMAIWLGKQYLDQKDNVEETKVPEEVMKPFVELMNQITFLQSARRMAESNSNSEQKSA